MIANISLDDGMILSHSANPIESNFRKRQPVDFGNKQRGSCTGYRRDVRSPLVCISLRLEYIQVSVSTGKVHALALRIDEEIVGITACIDGCNGATVSHGED